MNNVIYKGISVQDLMPYLTEKDTATKIFTYVTVDSTNNVAKEKAVKGAEHGTVIIADSQTAGRGRYGRVFYSPSEHGIYMSIVLDSSILGLSNPTLVTGFAAVSVCESIETVSLKKPHIKWVNDIFLDNKKVCGILTEATQSHDDNTKGRLIVGIGVNFDTPEFPDELKQVAGALFYGDEPVDKKCRLVSEIINRVTALGKYLDEEDILVEYKRRMKMLGCNVLVTDATLQYEAQAIDVDNVGRLVVKKHNNEILYLSTGEVKVHAAVNGFI